MHLHKFPTIGPVQTDLKTAASAEIAPINHGRLKNKVNGHIARLSNVGRI
jgi:hypothetical protein